MDVIGGSAFKGFAKTKMENAKKERNKKRRRRNSLGLDTPSQPARKKSLFDAKPCKLAKRAKPSEVPPLPPVPVSATAPPRSPSLSIQLLSPRQYSALMPQWKYAANRDGSLGVQGRTPCRHFPNCLRGYMCFHQHRVFPARVLEQRPGMWAGEAEVRSGS